MLMTFDKYEELNLATYVDGNQNKISKDGILNLKIRKILRYEEI